MRQKNCRVIIAGADLLGPAAFFFVFFSTVMAAKSHHPVEVMKTVGQVSDAAMLPLERNLVGS